MNDLVPDAQPEQEDDGYGRKVQEVIAEVVFLECYCANSSLVEMMHFITSYAQLLMRQHNAYICKRDTQSKQQSNN